MPKSQLIPLILSSLPFAVWLLTLVSQLQVFSWLRGVTDLLGMVFFLGPILLYDGLGLIRFHPLNTSSGSVWHDLVYALTAAVILYVIGKLGVRLLS